MPRGGKKQSPAVDRALNILEAISLAHSGITNAYLARRLGIPKSSACSILRVLQQRGYVCRYANNGRYKLGVQYSDAWEKGARSIRYPGLSATIHARFGLSD